MDHVDVVDTREMGAAPAFTTLLVTNPYSSDGTGRSPLSARSPATCPVHRRRAEPTPSSRSLAKPTLDPTRIRFCPSDQWVPDTQVLTCMAHDCNVSFSLFNRKHHCRICGRLFCAACCSHTVTIPTRGVDMSLLQPFLSLTETEEGTSSLLPSPRRVPTSPRSAPSSHLAVSYTAGVRQQPSPQVAPVPLTTTHRLCSSCFYEIQLVVSRRNHNGEARRKCRGELKMLQWPLLVRMLSYLSRHDLLEVSLVSSDFYFMSRDNLIWYQYNMAQCKQEELQLKLPVAGQQSSLSLRQRFRNRNKISNVKADFGPVTISDASKRVISLHSRYNFTQFLDFARRQEMARCKGLSSFSVGARMLLSSPLRIAIIGPSGIGKKQMVRHFVGAPATDPPFLTGFMRFRKNVHLSGGLTADVMLHIFNISGDPRYEELRRFLCSSCHVVGLCYDAQRKVTLVEAADVMMGVEPALGPQPVVVCGILRQQQQPESAQPHEPPRKGVLTAQEVVEEELPTREVTEVHAEGITVRGRGSVQCAWNRSERFFQMMIQCLLDRLSLATATPGVGVRSVSPRLTSEEEKERMISRSAAQELLQMTLNPCALDVLLDGRN